MRFLFVLIVLLTTHISRASNNEELAAMLTADQSSRYSTEGANPQEDQQRRERVFQLLAGNMVITPADKLAAAVILQHTPLSVCDGIFVSRSVENYLLANELARAAWLEGEERAQRLIAQTLDRYLVYTEGKQRYGTQRFWDEIEQQEVLYPIDPATTDSARVALGIDSLCVLLRTWPMKEAQP